MGGLFGGGSSVSIPQRSFRNEFNDIRKVGYPGQEKSYYQYINKDPLLKMLYGGAQDYFKAGDSDLLKEVQGTGLDVMRQGRDIATAGPSDLLSKITGAASDQLGETSPLLSKLIGTVSDKDYLSGHVTEQELANVVSDPLLAKFASQGGAFGNQAAAKAFLERDQYVEGRKKEHLGTAAGIEQLSESDISRRFGIASDAEKLGESDESRRFGIGQSGFAVGAAAEQLGEEATKSRFDTARGVLGSAASSFASLTNPVLAYASDLFSSNQNAAAAQSVAGANKAGGTASGIMSTIGSIAMAAGTAY